MDILDRVKHDAQSDQDLVRKYPSEKLRLGSQLIVSQSQEAILLKNGQALDVFGPGRHTLSTDNLPIIGRLVNLVFDDKTPFPAEVWIVDKRARRDVNWGTPARIRVNDKELAWIHVGAFGQWGFRVDDSRLFVNQLVGTLTEFDNAKVQAQFQSEIIQRFTVVLSTLVREKSFADLMSELNEISSRIALDLRPTLAAFGVEVLNFNISGVSLPKEEEADLQRFSSEKRRLLALGQSYGTVRVLDIAEKAAQNEGDAGGLLAAGLGLGVGVGAGGPIGQKLGQVVNESIAPPAGAPAAADPMARLKKLKEMLEAGLITAEDFERKKKEIVDAL
jgi:membrane protease subunit (stomatin/prohibitin family)